jgi:hypothetical protein
MKTCKQSHFFCLLAILALTFTACPPDNNGGRNQNDNNQNNQDKEGEQNPNGTNPGNDKEHLPSTDCDFTCVGKFIDSRNTVTAEVATGSTSHTIAVEDTFDDAVWESWNSRGGSYHKGHPAFKITGLGRTVSYGVDINGDGKIDGTPCFNADDCASGAEAVHSKY